MAVIISNGYSHEVEVENDVFLVEYIIDSMETIHGTDFLDGGREFDWSEKVVSEVEIIKCSHLFDEIDGFNCLDYINNNPEILQKIKDNCIEYHNTYLLY